VPCRAAAALERLRSIRDEMPPLSHEERARDHELAPVLSLHVSMLQLVVDVALRELQRLSTGRTELCDAHRLLPETADRASGTAEAEPLGLVRHFAMNDQAVAAVTRHTLARCARLWEALRPALPTELVMRTDVASVVEELDALTSEVLS
jgi:hypothetical protein